MTELDHSSVIALLYDLNRHRDGLFRFKYCGSVTSPPWRLKSALSLLPLANAVQFRIEYTTDGIIDDFLAKLDGGRLVYSTVVMTVVLEDGPPCGGFSSSVDDSQRGRLDENLKGVFS